MDHVAGPLHILLSEKEGRIRFNIIRLKLYHFKRITWWYLFLLEVASLDFKKKKVMVSRNLRPGPPLGGNTDANSDRPCALSTTCHVGSQVDFSLGL